MEHENLAVALWNLIESIRDIHLGSVTGAVIEDAGKALILNWNDHNEEDRIDEAYELQNWANRISNERSAIIIHDSAAQGQCACGEDH